jgi:hypothetical protein
MSNAEKREYGVDQLLRQVMADDLPEDLKAEMRTQIRDFKPAPKNNNRLLLAAASLVLVVLGGYLQITGSRSPLADSLATLQTAMSFSIEVERTSSMVCEVQLRRLGGDTLHYDIFWAPPQKTRIDVKAKDGKKLQTLWIVDDFAWVLDHGQSSVTRRITVQELENSLFQPVMGLSTPQRIAARMDGRWQLQTFRRQGNCDVGNYRIIHPQDQQDIQLTVDVCTFLPERILLSVPVTGPFGRMDHIHMSVRFAWNGTFPPSLFQIPGSTEGGGVLPQSQHKQEEL